MTLEFARQMLSQEITSGVDVLWAHEKVRGVCCSSGIHWLHVGSPALGFKMTEGQLVEDHAEQVTVFWSFERTGSPYRVSQTS